MFTLIHIRNYAVESLINWEVCVISWLHDSYLYLYISRRTRVPSFKSNYFLSTTYLTAWFSNLLDEAFLIYLRFSLEIIYMYILRNRTNSESCCLICWLTQEYYAPLFLQVGIFYTNVFREELPNRILFNSIQFQ